jgi:predicted TPR repeat methyltransferase
MFTQSAAFYDALYAGRGKDYRAESESLAERIRGLRPGAVSLLDVGCGTGAHLAEFDRLGFACRGVDASRWSRSLVPVAPSCRSNPATWKRSISAPASTS